MGDILGLYNSSKQLVTKYVYDAWGNHKVFALINNEFVDVTEHTITTSTTINEKVALLNPFRYRSYYFDSETGFYYLQSRYYDPQVGRFLNMDAIEQLDESIVNGINLYAYCCNDPINASDPDGTWLRALIGAAVGAVAGAVGQVISDVTTAALTGKPLKLSSWESYVGATVGGAMGGLTFAATGNKTLADAATGFATTMTTMALTNISGKTDYSLGEIAATSLVDAGASVVLGKIIPDKSAKSVVKPLANKAIKDSFIKNVGKGIVDGLALDFYYGAKTIVFDKVVNYLRPFNILKNMSKIRIGMMPITGGFC